MNYFQASAGHKQNIKAFRLTSFKTRLKKTTKNFTFTFKKKHSFISKKNRTVLTEFKTKIISH